MKALFVIAVMFASTSAASAQYDKNGTRSNQQGHTLAPQPTRENAQPNANGTTPNNYGAAGNKNDHTGQKGNGN